MSKTTPLKGVVSETFSGRETNPILPIFADLCLVSKLHRRVILQIEKCIIMPVLLDVNFSFFCRTTYKSGSGECPIILRVIFSNVRRDVFTAIYCAPKDWDIKTKRIKTDHKDAQKVNANLDLLLRNAHSAFDELKFSRQKFMIEDIVNKLKGKDEKPALLIDYLEQGVTRIKKRVGTEI